MRSPLIFLLMFCTLFSFEAWSRSMAAGSAHTCTQKNAQILCWGWNKHGQLGNGTTYDAAAAKVVSLAAQDLTTLAVGGSHTCAIKNNELYCWGKNYTSQLGTRDRSEYLTPQRIELPGAVTHVAAGLTHTCAVVEGGVMCWGGNLACQVGRLTECENVSENYRTVLEEPAFVEGLHPGSGATFVAAGHQNSCAIVDGGVYCWGQSVFGSLGDGKKRSDYVATPTQVYGIPKGSGATAISVGVWHICALVRGEVKCWGHKSMIGQKQNQHAYRPLTPTGLEGEVLRSVETHRHTTCAMGDTKVFCWGDGSFGQLGNGLVDSYSAIPIPVGLPGPVSDVTVGNDHVCATAAEQVYCWGSNTHCQMGSGSCPTSPTLTPSPPEGTD